MMPIFAAYFQPMCFAILLWFKPFIIKLSSQFGVDNIFNYVPHTLGSGVTMFNVPATCGARGYVQVEFLVEDILKSLKHKK